MGFEHPGASGLDYALCKYGASRLLVRGPKCRLTQPYTVFIGGTETFGRFVVDPFPLRLSSRLGIASVNLGCINAGLDAYAGDPALLRIAARAETTVIQVLGAANLTNPYYVVHPRRNDRVISVTPALRELYPETDFTPFNFTRHLLTTLERVCPERFLRVAEALKALWHERMLQILSEAGQRRILLWIASAPPPDSAVTAAGAPDPLFVDRDMLDMVAGHADEIVQVVPSPGAVSMGTSGMVYTDFDAHVAALTINAATHAEIADAIAPALGRRARAA